MWRKAFHAILCWLAFSQTSGEAVKSVISSLLNDNVSAESAPRLYRNVPVGVYASAAPYAAYSFHIPAYITAPKSSASRIVPVINNANGYLRDSYGNRFVETPQSAAYKTAFPQQFLPLQELPTHLAQPLVAASHAKQSSPHYFVGSQYRVPTYHVTQNPAQRFSGFSLPLVYAQNLRSLAPSPVAPAHTQAITQQQSSSSKALYTNIQPGQQYGNEVKFQRLEQQPAGNQVHASSDGAHTNAAQTQGDKGQIQAAPATITAVVNGKKTVVNIETKPPVPLLDISLLEPLTFTNPLVPQVQHFLPRIHDATYHKLPDLNLQNEPKKHKKDFTVTKTKSYDSGNVKAKTTPKKKSKQPKAEYDDDDDHPQNHHSVKPTVTIQGTPELNESPEISYEINSPNYKETYKEKSVSYNKASDADPVSYSYDEKTQPEPISYSYSKTEQKKPVSYNIVRTSEPGQIKHVITSQGNGQQPEQLIYTFKPEEQNREQNDHHVESEDAGSAENSSEESDDDRPSHPQGHFRAEDRPHAPNQANHQSYHNPQSHPSSQSHASPQNHHHHPQSHHHTQSHHNTQSHHHPQNHHYPQSNSGKHGHPHPQSHNNKDYHEPSKHSHNQRPNDGYHGHHPHQNEGKRHHEAPHSDQVEHRAHESEHHRHDDSPHYKPREEIRHKPEENGYHRQNEQVHHKPDTPHHRSGKIKVPVIVPSQYPVTQEYEEDIKIVPSEAPAANLKGHPAESEKEENPYFNFQSAPLSSLQQYQHFIEQQKQSQAQAPLPQVHSSVAPVIHEKAKRIIIQEESPEEMRVHQEQNIMAEMIDDDGNDEEDFEKAYKNAAYGFQAFDGNSGDREKDIYNPANYGFSHDHDNFEIEKTPFQEYHAEGDQFPKGTRAEYKDARDNTKDDYYSEYAINQPASMADLYQNKANYYKLYKKYKPDKYFADENDKRKEKKSGKYTVEPSFNFNPAPEKKQNYFAQYKAEPIKYEYKFAKETPRHGDSSAYASRPFQRYKSKTNFVEPQFQYGFEPIAIPRLLDSELSAMASNDSPESEKPGTRKKIYKENWYIKKTSTSGGKPS